MVCRWIWTREVYKKDTDYPFACLVSKINEQILHVYCIAYDSHHQAKRFSE